MIQHPARQVHLDFHTSEHIPDVGRLFDKKQWQEALKIGRVNAINIFAKGHHGWAYYPTKAGAVHPTLDRDLLGEQIAACHQIGVRCPIYFTVGWSVHDAETHPEWIVRDKAGNIWPTDPKLLGTPAPDDRRQACSWRYLCPSAGYMDLILAQTAEILQAYQVDGFWYDICGGPVCYCDTCLAGMRAEGYDPELEADARAYNALKWERFMTACNDLVLQHFPEATIYYNGTTVMYPDSRHSCHDGDYWKLNTHYELEDLPTTWGGYDKFSMRSKYFLKTGKQIIAMSGKFHTSWGEFGGFKHPDALRYEAATQIAHGAACNFGDQLHPSGLMDMGTYANLGEAFKYVEQIEDYGLPSKVASNLGLWRTGVESDDQGVVSMLLETQTDYDVVYPEEDLSVYDAIILTGQASLTVEQAAKLRAYVAGGGGLLVLGESALGPDKTAFVLDVGATTGWAHARAPWQAGKTGFLLDVGATFLGPANYDIDYTVVGDTLAGGMVQSPFLNYAAAIRVEPDADAEVLATVKEPYFDRTYAKFCSHQNTPNRLETAPHPAALKKGRVLFLPHCLGDLYYRLGARVHRDVFRNALGLIYRQPLVETDMPSCGRITLMKQEHRNRYVVHLMYAPALQRGRCLVIEDLVPLYDVPIKLRVPEEIQKVYLVPSSEPLTVSVEDGVVGVTVPKVECHQAVVFEY